MMQTVHASLEDRFEEVPDPLTLKAGRAVWRALSRGARATWRFCRAVAENRGVRTTAKFVGGTVLMVLILPFAILGAIFR